MSAELEKIRTLVETPCLAFLQHELHEAHKHGSRAEYEFTRGSRADELANDIGKLVSSEPTSYVTFSVQPPPGYEAHGPVKLGFSLGIFPRDYIQKVPVSTPEEQAAVSSRRVTLLTYAQHWFRAFSEGSPELARQCAQALGLGLPEENPGPGADNLEDPAVKSSSVEDAPGPDLSKSYLRLTASPARTGLVLSTESENMLGVAVFLIRPDGTFAYLPREKVSL